MGANSPLTLALSASPRLAAALALAHGAAVGAVLAAGFPLWLTSGIAAGLVAHGGAVILRVGLLRGRAAVVALEVGREDTLAFQTRDGAWHAGRILATTFVAPFLTVINLDVPGERRARHVTIVPDAVDAEAFRRLRTWLRWGWKPARGRS